MPETKHTPGPWLNITTSDGELIERIDLGEYNLDKPLARASLVDDIADAKRRAIAKAESR